MRKQAHVDERQQFLRQHRQKRIAVQLPPELHIPNRIAQHIEKEPALRPMERGNEIEHVHGAVIIQAAKLDHSW